MNQQDCQNLMQLGLTEGEAKTYLALLELGSSTVGPIVKKAGVAYSNIYEILDRLLKKGVVSQIIKEKTKHFQAVSPSNLKLYLDKKEGELQQQKQSLHALLPRLQQLRQFQSEKEAMMFIGMKGLRAAYDELFKDPKPEEENLWIYAHDKRFEEMSDRFYLHQWFSLAKKIKSRGISDSSYLKSKFIVEFKKKYAFRSVDFPIFSHGEVFKDKFLLVSWEEPVVAVLVQAKHVSDNFKKYFESVWRVAKK